MGKSRNKHHGKQNRRGSNDNNGNGSMSSMFDKSADAERAQLSSNIIARLKKETIITPKTEGQAALWNALNEDNTNLDFALGPAGSGKTYMGIAKAMRMLALGEVEKIILARPAVDAGEQLGFLPGDQNEKVAPFLVPLMDAVTEIANKAYLDKGLQSDAIQIVPISYMRGRTFRDAAVVLDEAQNCTFSQLKMATTRLGEGSRMIMAGDPGQSDLPKAQQNGFNHFVEAMKLNPDGIGMHFLSAADIVRAPIVRTVSQNLDDYLAQNPELDFG